MRLKSIGERDTEAERGKFLGETEQRWKSGCLYMCLSFSCRAAVVNLACAPVSSSEVIDVCSIQKACWETVTDLSQAPWTSRLIPRTEPSAFRNSQMAAFEGFTVPNVYVHVCVPVCACIQAFVCLCMHAGIK